MDFAKFEILKNRLRIYVNVNKLDLEALRANLDAPSNVAIRAIFRDELAEIVQGDAMTRAEYEAITDEEYASDTEWKAYLLGLQSYLFDGGPHP